MCRNKASQRIHVQYRRAHASHLHTGYIAAYSQQQANRKIYFLINVLLLCPNCNRHGQKIDIIWTHKCESKVTKDWRFYAFLDTSEDKHRSTHTHSQMVIASHWQMGCPFHFEQHEEWVAHIHSGRLEQKRAAPSQRWCHLQKVNLAIFGSVLLAALMRTLTGWW